ncbi:hypothetical protein [Pseudaminobacter soli (ex Li et al. 2025)]|uniref:DUF5681 domain-containing protein n=1 Tax=Pseudaminobacter soli (ex Li et al. 2025) TaxID=1295366 RepID=A0A2P7SE36_9HYPH|nr:hypothetical protein [Mesorhizobium soli]PSJ60759.1 hypothetical protein C7I85_12005 [Mesorhizobium soli]
MAGKSRGGHRPGAGRPSGARSRATAAHKATLSDLARAHTSTALQVLVNVAKDGESESARVAAANALLDRAYGKPRQSHEHSGPNGGPITSVDLTKLSGDELAQLESIFGPLAGSGDDDAPDQGGEGA